MHAVLLLVCVAGQLKEPPYLSLEWSFRTPSVAAMRPNVRQAAAQLVDALRQKHWKPATVRAKEAIESFRADVSQRTEYLDLQLAELHLVAGDAKSALEIAQPFLAPLGQWNGKTIRTAAELYALGGGLFKANPSDAEKAIVARSNEWAHYRGRALRLVVDVFLVLRDFPTALKHQEALLQDQQAAPIIEFDRGVSQIEMESYLLPLRAVVRGDLAALRELANRGFAAHLSEKPDDRYADDEPEQKRKIAAIAAYVLARYYQSKNEANLADENFKKAVTLMEERGVVTNREILLWFLAQEELKRD